VVEVLTQPSKPITPFVRHFCADMLRSGGKLSSCVNTLTMQRRQSKKSMKIFYSDKTVTLISCRSFYLEFTSLADSIVTKELLAFALKAA